MKKTQEHSIKGGCGERGREERMREERENEGERPRFYIIFQDTSHKSFYPSKLV